MADQSESPAEVTSAITVYMSEGREKGPLQTRNGHFRPYVAGALHSSRERFHGGAVMQAVYICRSLRLCVAALSMLHSGWVAAQPEPSASAGTPAKDPIEGFN